MLHTSTLKTFIATQTIPAGARVKYVGNNQVSLSSDTDTDIGNAILHSGKTSYAANEPVGVQMKFPTRHYIAAGAFADGATVKQMANGKVDDTGSGANCAIALEAAAADGDLVECIPL